MKQLLQQCCWIGTDEAYASPVITRIFSLPESRRATLTITGLGYFHASVNGSPVTEYCFLPVVSDYEPRDLSSFGYPLHDSPTNRIYCYTFDITRLVQAGENRLDIQLGNGFYRQTERIAEGRTDFSSVLKAVYRIDAETENGPVAILSNGSETQQDSVIRCSNLFHGEVIDLTAPLQPPKPVSVLPSPQAELSPATGTPDRIIRIVTPVLLGAPHSRKVFDAGENLSGIVRIKTTAPAGSRITLRFAEICREYLSLDFVSTGSLHTSASGRSQIQEDTFITDGQQRVFQPRFVWHAFRYFEVEGPFDEAEICVIHSDTPVTASFHSSLEGQQFLYDAFLRTQLANMHGSYPSDCPHRERLGYLGDGQVCTPAAMMLLDSRHFYEKWIQDILDCQDPFTGHVQHTAPLMGGGGGPGVWGSAIVFVPYAHYRQYGDVSMLQKCFDPMLRWIHYLTSRCEDGLITHEEEGGWCLGDWCTLEPIQISVSYVNTCCFVKILLLLEEIAALISRQSVVPRLRELRIRSEQALVRRFYHPSTGRYDTGMQGADAYAVWCGIAGVETMRRTAEAYDQLGHFDTGFAGTDILLEMLFTHGFGQTAVRLLESRETGSYLYMKDHGATTIWENWNGAESHNHPMFAAGARHLFTGVLGVRQRKGTAGYQDLIIQPCRLPAGENVSGSLLTPQGTLSVTLDYSGPIPTVTVHAPASIRIAFAEDGLEHTLITTA